MNTRRATVPHQGISIDFGFIVQESKVNPQRLERLSGLHGETCYCLITDHHSKALYGECFASKNPPVEFLNTWLTKYDPGPTVKDKYVRMDQGGELSKSAKIVALFQNSKYRIEPTASNSSHQNGPVERPHRTIGAALRCMLFGASLPFQYWPHAFHHYLRIYNSVPHANDTKSPFEVLTGKVPNLSQLRTFGCRMTALPPRTRRPSTLENEPRNGRFLGYARTMKNAIYLDVDTGTIKTCEDVAFNEAGKGYDDLAPNDKLLQLEGTLVNEDIIEARTSKVTYL